MPASTWSLDDLRTIAEYQFGAPAGAVLFPSGESFDIDRSRTGRPRQIHASAGRLVSLTTLGRFTLGIEGGNRLHNALTYPAYRVQVGTESEPFIRDGKNAFAKFVKDTDREIRPGDEVLVVNPNDDLLGVGRAELSATGMQDFSTGMAVQIRHGNS